MDDFSTNLAWFIAGAIVGLITNLVSPLIFESLRRQYRIWFVKRTTKTGNSPISDSSLIKERLSVGGFSVNWIILQYANYLPSRMHITYDDRKVPLLDEFARMKDNLIVDIKKRMARGEANVPHNGAMYKLKEFDVGYREVIDGEEVPILRLRFGPTDYFSQKVTDLNVGNPIREKYAKVADVTLSPVREFSSIVGVNLNIITSDGYLVIAERSKQTEVAAGRLHTSVAENLLRPTDAGSNGAPDPFRCAIRGIQEELGLVVDIGAIEFSAFGVQPELCQYSLIGWTRVRENQAEVEEIRTQAIPKDKAENRRLIFVPCNPKSIAEFVFVNRDRWFAIGEAAAVLSLFQLGYSRQEINQAFQKVKG